MCLGGGGGGGGGEERERGGRVFTVVSDSGFVLGL